MWPISWFKRYDVDTERELDADPKLLPIKIEHRQSFLLALFFLLVGGVFLATPLVIFTISQQLTGGDRLALSLPLVIGIWVTLRSLRNLNRARKLFIGEGQVQAEKQ